MTKWTKTIPAVLLCEALLAVLMVGCSSSASAQCNDKPEIGRVTFSFVNLQTNLAVAFTTAIKPEFCILQMTHTEPGAPP